MTSLPRSMKVFPAVVAFSLAACGGSSSTGDGGSGAGGSSSSTISSSGGSSSAAGSSSLASSSNAGSSSSSSSSSSSGGSGSGPLGGPGICNPSPGYAGNELGIGGYCTTNAQCLAYSDAGLVCTNTEPGGKGEDFCISIGTCTKDSDCGSGACCVYEIIEYACIPVACAADGGTTCPN